MKNNVYDIITNRIIEELEKGSIPWKKPWVRTSNNSLFISHTTGKFYSILNQQLLGTPGEFLTFKQAVHEKGKVLKGERAGKVVFYKPVVTDKDATPGQWKDDNGKLIVPILKWYSVFNVLTQIEGIEPKYIKKATLNEKLRPIYNGEKVVFDYVEREKIDLTFDQLSDEAYYYIVDDSVRVPILGQFQNANRYYSTVFHELIHSTRHPARLDRKRQGGFGSDDYAREELTAEIGAAILCHLTGIETPETFENSAAYVQNWLNALKNDKTLIVKASANAEKAVNFILGINPKNQNFETVETVETVEE